MRARTAAVGALFVVLMTCGRPPLVFAVRSDAVGGTVTENYEGTFAKRIGRESDTDTLLRAKGAALTWFNESGAEYDAIPRLKGGVSEIEVKAYDYARCRVLVSGANRSDFPGRTRWLDRDVSSRASNETRIVVTAANGTQVRHDGRTLRPARLPTGPETAGLRRTIRQAQSNGTAADDVERVEVTGVQRGDATAITYRFTGTVSELTELHAALLAPRNSESAGVDFLRAGQSRQRDALARGGVRGPLRRTVRDLRRDARPLPLGGDRRRGLPARTRRSDLVRRGHEYVPSAVSDSR